jgi:hypothetical protein
MPAIINTILLGAVTGMRSLSGLAAVGVTHRRWWAPLARTAAAAEMIADKTRFVGDRIEPLPLTGRLVLGGMTGVAVAGGRRAEQINCALVGAVAALVSAHLSYRARVRFPAPNVAKGFLEDVLVLTLIGVYARGAGHLVGRRTGLKGGCSSVVSWAVWIPAGDPPEHHRRAHASM